MSGLRYGCNSLTSIDWVDFIKFNDITYLRVINKAASINDQDLAFYDEIKFSLYGNVNDPSYRIKNGDSAFLDKGTPVYSLKGYSPSFRLVVKGNQQQINNSGELFLVYEADTNLNARTGADLLDIEGKVEYIGINSKIDGKTELASIRDEKTVAELVRMILKAPVDQSTDKSGSEQYFIDIHLKDGSEINRCYWLDTNVLSRGILLPNEFAEAIRAALSPSTMTTNTEVTSALRSNSKPSIFCNGNISTLVEYTQAATVLER